jgi:hypothetical protein
MEDNTLLILNVSLVVICLSAIVVIIILMIQNHSMSEEINEELSKIEKECPKCELNCPENHKCPQCPRCPEYPKIPENDPKMPENDPKMPENGKCPACPNCPQCPSVEDIVTGIYPGRNPKVADGGRYFEVDASNTYDGLSTSNLYDKNYKFPMDKILRPDSPEIRAYNLGGEDQINNSIENENINTSKTKGLSTSSGPLNNNLDSAPLNNLDSIPTVFDGYQQILPENF